MVVMVMVIVIESLAFTIDCWWWMSCVWININRSHDPIPHV